MALTMSILSSGQHDDLRLAYSEETMLATHRIGLSDQTRGLCQPIASQRKIFYAYANMVSAYPHSRLCAQLH